MITIIYDEKGKDMSLQTSGHAGYAPKGQDIVCAAVSTLMQSLAYGPAASCSGNSRCLLRPGRGQHPARTGEPEP